MNYSGDLPAMRKMNTGGWWGPALDDEMDAAWHFLKGGKPRGTSITEAACGAEMSVSSLRRRPKFGNRCKKCGEYVG